MKKNLFYLLAVLCSSQAFSQPASASGASIFLELGGNGGLLSVNYDQRFSEGTNGFGGRIGVGVGAGRSTNHAGFPSAVLTIPIAINYLVGKGPHHLEGSAGVTLGTSDFSAYGDEESSVAFVPGLGYRYHPVHRRFTVRFMFTPFLSKETEYWAGLSFGIRL